MEASSGRNNTEAGAAAPSASRAAAGGDPVPANSAEESENGGADIAAIRRKLTLDGTLRSDFTAVGARTSSGRVVALDGSAHGKHSFDEEEMVSYAEHINRTLVDDPDLAGVLPLDPSSMDIFDSLTDGVLLCKLVNHAVPGTIAEGRINKKKPLSLFKINDNLNLALKTMQRVGCNIVNVGPEDFRNKRVHLVLAVLWQVVQKELLSHLTLRDHPELFRLVEANESVESLLHLPREHLLLRWLNYQLNAAGSDRRVRNFTTDLRDSEALTLLLHQVAPEHCALTPLDSEDVMARAEGMLTEAEHIKCRKFLTPTKVVVGHKNMMIGFLASVFNSHPGLKPLSDEELRDLQDAVPLDMLPAPEPEGGAESVDSDGLERVSVGSAHRPAEPETDDDVDQGYDVDSGTEDAPLLGFAAAVEPPQTASAQQGLVAPAWGGMFHTSLYGFDGFGPPPSGRC